jgi:multimeric flavodoxin WrbA
MAAKVYIIIYSLYHHIYTLAQEVQKGLVAQGVDAKIFQGKLFNKNTSYNVL